MKSVSALVWGLAFVALASCQTLTPQSGEEEDAMLPQGKDRFALIYLPGRRAAIEPCGCAFIPRGGIVREWNQRRLWDKQKLPTLSMEADTSFLPNVFYPQNADYYRKKATLISRVMAEMAIDVFSPSYEDLALGQATAREWEKTSRAHWISANLFDRKTQQRIFAPSYRTTLAGHDVRVLGVSSCKLGPGYPKEASVDCRPVVDSLRDVFAKDAGASALNVLIGSLQPAERVAVREAFPQVRIVFNSDFNNYEEYTVQEDAGHLYVNPLDRSMQLIRVVMAGPTTAPSFYYPIATSAAFSRMDDLKTKIANTESELKRKQKPAHKQFLVSQLARYRRELKGAELVSNAGREGSMEYYPTTQSLDDTTEPAKGSAPNPMAKAYEKFREENKEYLANQSTEE